MTATTEVLNALIHHRKATLIVSIGLVLVGTTSPTISLAQNDQSSQSLATLAKYYHSTPSTNARCHGEWTAPITHSLTQELGADSPLGSALVQADYGYWDNQDHAELSGNVILEQQGQQITADKLGFRPSTGEILAEGQVLFSDTNLGEQNTGVGMMGIAQKLTHNANKTTAQDVAFASRTISAHGHAGTLQKHTNSHYQMSDVMFSTCPPNERKWQLEAQSIDINTTTGRGIAKNATLKISQVPVFYLPYFDFPIDDRRAGGFLLPSVGFGNDSVKLSAPYYLNLHPQYDLTLTPTLFNNKNPLITGEFRYLTANYGSGVITGSFLPKDRTYHHQDRSRVQFHHHWQSQKYPHLSAYATYHHVSDKDYLSDFDNLGVENNPLNLSRKIGATYYNDHIVADLRAETFLTLDGTKNDGLPILDKDRPYFRLPQLSVNYRLPSIYTKHGTLEFTGTHNSAYFKKDINDGSELQKSGFRAYNQLTASYPVLKSWGYLTPTLGLTHLYASYDQDSRLASGLTKAESTYSVFAPQLSVDMGLFFEKAGSPFGRFAHLGGHQTLSPRLKYTRTPYKDQKNLPNFDTTLSAISYDQLLLGTWFLGHDRILDLHAITPAVEYRYVDKDGLTRFDGGIAKQILLDEVKVSLDDTQHFTQKNSGLVWKANSQLKHNVWLDTSGALTPTYDLHSLIAQVRYQPNDQGLLNAGLIKRNAHQDTGQLSLTAITASAILPINHRWRLLSQAQYDLQNRRLLDALVGINYEDCCYGLSIYARRYRNDLSPTELDNTLMAELRLNGISSQSSLNRLLSERIMGYDHTQNAWQYSD